MDSQNEPTSDDDVSLDDEAVEAAANEWDAATEVPDDDIEPESVDPQDFIDLTHPNVEPDPQATKEELRAIEAVLMVTEEPLPPQLLAELLETTPARIEAMCRALADEYEEQERGFILVKVAGGYRYQSHPDLAPYIERYVLEGQSARLSSAALETLAIVAYKQPLSRAQIGSIRGVNVDAVVRTLHQRGYIEEVGIDPGPGQAILYGTSSLFLEKLGLSSLEDLPPLEHFVPGPEVVEALEQGLSATS